jgi:hypothetical protein
MAELGALAAPGGRPASLWACVPCAAPHKAKEKPHSVKIATFNINNVNNRLANLLGWLRRERCNGSEIGTAKLKSAFLTKQLSKA